MFLSILLYSDCFKSLASLSFMPRLSDKMCSMQPVY